MIDTWRKTRDCGATLRRREANPKCMSLQFFLPEIDDNLSDARCHQTFDKFDISDATQASLSLKRAKSFGYNLSSNGPSMLSRL